MNCPDFDSCTTKVSAAFHDAFCLDFGCGSVQCPIFEATYNKDLKKPSEWSKSK